MQKFSPILSKNSPGTDSYFNLGSLDKAIALAQCLFNAPTSGSNVQFSYSETFMKIFLSFYLKSSLLKTLVLQLLGSLRFNSLTIYPIFIFYNLVFLDYKLSGSYCVAYLVPANNINVFWFLVITFFPFFILKMLFTIL